MNHIKFLTPEEVTERYRGQVTVGTLRNWRAMRIGPPFVKIGKSVLYSIEALNAWDHKNTVACDKSERRQPMPHELGGESASAREARR